MLAGMMLATGDGFDVNAVRCADACRGFDTAEETTGHALVFVRRGAFVRRTAGREVLLDSTVHTWPFPARNRSARTRWARATPAVPMDAASEFAIRHAASLARGADIDGELAEQVVGTVAALVARGRPGGSGGGSQRRGPAARERLARQARELLLAEPGLGVIELARRVSCSPHYLSRVFSQVTGSSISATATGSGSAGPSSGSARASAAWPGWPMSSASPTMRT